MQHVDPEVLALLALGEHGAASDDEHSHLAACAVCRAEEASLAQVVEVARADDRGLVAPPPEVWERVRAEVGRAEPEPAPVVDLASRRRRPSVLWGAVAASVALVAGAGVGVLWERSQVPEPPTEIAPVAVAEAELEPLPDWPASAGRAVVTESTGGELEIVVDVGGAEAGDGYREVWLIADDLSGMVSLGVLEGTSGTFPVPAGLDLATYSLVDVSEEPFDGDPTHSGDSIVRGGLTEA
ncbi:anti-sigma-K factor rskA [Isoptericola sp. CG 20/1183]|uniref:Anti-sigma-K factor rskA n=1 Tax=Isoptericola halotolerans TaxID=300560 RepID=A0ABX5EAX3_9MICO|nr:MULTISPECIES: anti-sigma factor [Isoptericola]PRZ04352.1 anti-sigma-K factor rskA [Isoptericola halotolerans]PRZ04750.1 anti-sigma-K factor rskA [Isoptericola sp. CG 20/1183]